MTVKRYNLFQELRETKALTQTPERANPERTFSMNINDAFNLLNITSSATQEEIAKAYRKASLKYHPDRNPAGAQMMQAINAAYNFLKKQGVTVSPQEGFNANDYAEELNDILNQLFALDGLVIEICGNWIWISGETKKHAKALGKNGIGCFYASKKKMWYFRPADYKSSGRGSWSIDKIREEHGSQTPKRKFNNRLAA